MFFAVFAPKPDVFRSLLSPAGLETEKIRGRHEVSGHDFSCVASRRLQKRTTFAYPNLRLKSDR
jgi:hypothetical protein